MSEETGDAQQVEAVASGDEEIDQDFDAHVARVDLESDIAGVAATGDLGVTDPQSVHLRYLEDGMWSEWVDLEFENLTLRDGGASPTQAGTEIFLLANAQAAEVVARTAEGYSVPGLTVTVIDAEGLAPVDNSLADLAVPEGEDEDTSLPSDEQVSVPSDEQKLRELKEEAPAGSEVPDVGEPSGGKDELLDLEGAHEVDGAMGLSGAVFGTAENRGPTQFEEARCNADGSACDTGFQGLKINTRKAWGANESCMTWKREPTTIQAAVAHHTQGNVLPHSSPDVLPDSDHLRVPRTHARLGDIGCNLIVDKYGGV